MYGEQAKHCLMVEAKAIQDLISRINGEFDQAVGMILDCRGRIVVTGIGKSGLIGRKISATLASTGTPSFFLHPSEGLHGDVGMVTGEDIVLAISNSGGTAELLGLLPALKRIGARIIAMCGRRGGELVQNADLFLDVGVEREACPLGLTPTASTTATLAMGDALAMALLASFEAGAATAHLQWQSSDGFRRTCTYALNGRTESISMAASETCPGRVRFFVCEAV